MSSKTSSKASSTTRHRHRRAPRGQAMLEYSMLNWLLLVGLMLGMTVRLIPRPPGRANVIELFLEAYQVYYDSFVFVLNMPLP